MQLAPTCSVSTRAAWTRQQRNAAWREDTGGTRRGAEGSSLSVPSPAFVLSSTEDRTTCTVLMSFSYFCSGSQHRPHDQSIPAHVRPLAPCSGLQAQLNICTRVTADSVTAGALPVGGDCGAAASASKIGKHSGSRPPSFHSLQSQPLRALQVSRKPCSQRCRLWGL